MQRAHQVPYVPAVRLAGAAVVEVGNLMNTDESDIAAAITDRTVAILHVAGGHLPRGKLALDRVVEVAAEHRLPVIVDAAAQLPPAKNLWRYTRQHGAALAIFSGGKDLCGPQASGLLVGRADLIEAARLHGSPNQRLARAMKAGKEEIVGLVAAVEEYLAIDDAERRAEWDRILSRWQDQLLMPPISAITISRTETNEAGQPIPRLVISWQNGPSATALQTTLLVAEPAVAVAIAGERAIGLTPETLAVNELDHVAPAIRRALVGVER